MVLFLLVGVLFRVEFGVPRYQVSEAVDHLAAVIDIGTQAAPLNRQSERVGGVSKSLRVVVVGGVLGVGSLIIFPTWHT